MMRLYFWDDSHLYKEGVDGVIKHCVPRLLLPSGLDAQFGTPYPRSAGFDTDNDPHLYKEGVDGVIRRCVLEHEQEQILRKCHSEAYGQIELLIRYCDPVSIRLLFSKMPISLSCLVMNVKELVILVDVKKCL